MLDFIILGLIPGTSVQITFGWVLIITIILAGLLSVRLLDEHSQQNLSRITTDPPLSR